ncbi:MAG: 3-dehydroquinate synthase [Planctomycetes bacterium]|nr:3-dehydroquinate synthase [Planctomycetota bacterium]
MTARPLFVEAPGGHYPIFIGSNLVDRLPAWIEKQGGCSSIHVVSDQSVQRLHGGRIRKALAALGLPIHGVAVPAGEPSKSARELVRLWRSAVRAGIDRRGWLLALGGGVVGDLAGFAAASILRGVAFVQVPTSLLAMVDSSVGGKTGINLPEGKNLVGAFYQPRGVFIDLEFLKTLPRREYLAGWAEIVKAAAIRDAGLFRQLERHAGRLSRLDRGDPRLLERIIRRACQIKAEVVSADERESGLRMILNFGHTLAHGLEAAAGYQGLIHGEAVAIGMAFAARLGCALGLAKREAGERIEALERRLGLPARLPERYVLPAGWALAAMQKDKKAGAKGLRWVLVPEIGSARIVDDIPWSAAQAAVKQFLSERE